MERLRVLTFNLWNRREPWVARRELIRRELDRLEPHLVGLQEVVHDESAGENQADELARGLGYHAVFGPTCRLDRQLLFGNAVLSRFPVVGQRRWPLPVPVGEEPRVLLGVEVDAPVGRIAFFVTHLCWKLDQGSVRLAQVQFIVDRVLEDEAARPQPALLVGDFNAEPDSDEMRFLRGHHVVAGRSVYFADCFRWAGEGRGETFCRRNRYAREVHEPDRCLDYIFVRGGDERGRGEPLSARVVLDQPDAAGVFASDHFGVFAEIGMIPHQRGT